MATVKQVQDYLSKMNPEENILAVIVTREEFNSSLVADGPSAYTESLWKRYLDYHVDENPMAGKSELDLEPWDRFHIGLNFLESEFGMEQPSSWSFFQKEYELMYLQGPQEAKEAYVQELFAKYDLMNDDLDMETV